MPIAATSRANRDTAGLDAENQSQHQHTEAAGKADADAAQTGPQPDEEKNHQQFDNPHENASSCYFLVRGSGRNP